MVRKKEDIMFVLLLEGYRVFRKTTIKQMKVTSTLILFLFLTICACGQGNSLRTKLIDDNYSWITLSGAQLDSFYFDLQPIQTTKFKTHFRVSMTGQIIDFYYYENEKYQGKLTNYTTEYISVKNKDAYYNQSKEYCYVIEQIELEQAKVEKFVEKFIKTGQIEIPTDTLIASWERNYLDCNSLVFQFNINGKYTKQIFHCPWGQKDSVEFKSIIIDNYQTLISTFQLDSIYEVFESKLPNGKIYSRDGHIMMHKLTVKQSENWKKTQSQKEFMKSVKDSVDSYLNSELTKQSIELNGINCFENYRLTFGQNGKLKDISLSHYDKPKLKNSLGLGDYLADKREIRKCRRKIKQMFGEIDMSFLNLKYEIYRTFSFNHKAEYQLSDVTTGDP